MKSRYKRAKELLETITADRIAGEELKKLIMINLGSDERQTVRPYIRMMIKTGLIKIEGENVIILKL